MHPDSVLERTIAVLLFNSGCKPSVSTGTHGRLTYGYGALDEYGFWEFSLPDGAYVECE